MLLRAKIVSAKGASETVQSHLNTALPRVQRSRVPRSRQRSGECDPFACMLNVVRCVFRVPCMLYVVCCCVVVCRARCVCTGVRVVCARVGGWSMCCRILSALPRLSYMSSVSVHQNVSEKRTDDIPQKRIHTAHTVNNENILETTENIPGKTLSKTTKKPENIFHKKTKTDNQQTTAYVTENIPQKKATTYQSILVCRVFDAYVFTSCESQALMFSHSHHHASQCVDKLLRSTWQSPPCSSTGNSNLKTKVPCANMVMAREICRLNPVMMVMANFLAHLSILVLRLPFVTRPLRSSFLLTQLQLSSNRSHLSLVSMITFLVKRQAI